MNGFIFCVLLWRGAFNFAGMTIWIIALVLLVMFAGMGYTAGAIRSAVSLLGLFLAAGLCVPLGPTVQFVFPMFGYTHPLIPVIFGPIIVFFLIEIIFRIVGGVVHRKAEHHYKYDAADATRVLWERMNRRVGSALGAINAMIYLILICLFVSVVGYLLIQTGGDKNPSFIYRFLATAAADLKTTKMDKVVAAFSPAPEKYFEISDLLGLLFHNRLLQNRVESYPPFIAMADRPFYKALGADTALQEKLQSEVNVFEILDHPKIQEIVTNSELSGELLSTDLKDFRTYLETGVSPKYDEEKILGRWGYNVDDTIRLAKQAKPDLTATVWKRTKNELAERYEGAVFIALTDKRAFLNLPGDVRTAPPMLQTNLLPTGKSFITTNLSRWMTTNASFSAKGTWKGATKSGYQVTLKDKLTPPTTSDLVVKDGKLSFTFEDRAVVFDKLAQP